MQRHDGLLVVDGSERRANVADAFVTPTYLRAGSPGRLGNYLVPGSLGSVLGAVFAIEVCGRLGLSSFRTYLHGSADA
jgi:hypothetical protein